MDITGYMGAVTSSREANEACVIEKTLWATQCWEETASPTVGDQVTLGSSPSWHVVKSIRTGCALVLDLCRALIACPDCLATVYSVERVVTDEENCDKWLEPVSIASEVPATVCPIEEDVEVWGDAEIARQRVLICLEGVSDIQPQMVVSCGSNNYRVTSIRQRCSGACLTTVEAELDTLGLLDR